MYLWLNDISAMIQPVEMKQQDLATLVVADEYYQAFNDFSDAMTEEMMVMECLAIWQDAENSLTFGTLTRTDTLI